MPADTVTDRANSSNPSDSAGSATVLVVGGGGREHALAWKLAASEHVDRVLVAPGNAGTAQEHKCENVAVAADDIGGLLELAQQEAVALTVVGPEAPLAAGIADRFADAGLAIFGPSQAGARLEASKSFAKDFFAKHQIPTAAYAVFSDVTPAIDFIRQRGAPIVVKADGLAAGKGVIVAQTEQEAEDAVRDMLSGNSFGEAGHQVVIEDFLAGEEASFIVVASGTEFVEFASSQDHKAAFDGDTGPNTGGMGAYSPAPVVTSAVRDFVVDSVIKPTLQGLADDGVQFTGFLYAGLMVAEDGTAKVLEFNCRMGDPETQPLLMRLESDLYELLSAAARGDLSEQAPRWTSETALGVVLAAKGYPGSYPKGDAIAGLDSAAATRAKVFHAGTRALDGKTVTAGGRVLCVTARGASVAEAQRKAYAGVADISWDGMQYRTDIGHRAIDR